MFDPSAEFTAALEAGNWALALPLIYLVGLATALTPCVYPMIAITVSVFGARQVKTRAEGATLSLVFVLGMATLFTPLGVIAGYTGGLFGEWSGSPWVLIPMAFLFAVMATAMFGAFELNLPPALQNKLAQVGGTGYGGAFALGMVSALIAAPCTGPGFLALLAWIGQTGNVALGAGATFTYAIGLGTLFFFVGTFATSLPKSGAWMEHVKSIFGVVMLVMAIYYLRNLIGLDELITHDWVMLAGGSALLLVGLGLGAIHLDFHVPDPKIRARKSLGIALSVVGSYTMLGWLVAPAAGLEWREDFQTAIAEARESGQPYIVDFGADWCGACGELERNTFTDERVMAEGGRFIAVHVDMSPSVITEEKRQLLASYTTGRGLPVVVFHDSEGNEVRRVLEFVEPDEFLEMMREVE